jgi:hypothetical protein
MGNIKNKNKKGGEKIKRMIFDSYLALLKNSNGSKMFKNYYVKINGAKRDVMQNGNLSCAFFVSSVLLIFELIANFHGTVAGLEKDLMRSGWKKIKKLKVGSVLIWEKKKNKKNEEHYHIGFYLGNKKAISNYDLFKKIKIHHYTFNNKRKIEKIYWHKNLK